MRNFIDLICSNILNGSFKKGNFAFTYEDMRSIN